MESSYKDPVAFNPNNNNVEFVSDLVNGTVRVRIKDKAIANMRVINVTCDGEVCDIIFWMANPNVTKNLIEQATEEVSNMDVITKVDAKQAIVNNSYELGSLEDTVEQMLSDDYRDRFISEYRQTAIRLDRLERLVSKMRHGLPLDFEPTCSVELLDWQCQTMRNYLYVLRIRGDKEGLILPND